MQYVLNASRQSRQINPILAEAPVQLVIRNDGPLIESTNYWDSPLAKAGKLYLSLNAGAFRLLVPPIYYEAVEEMGTGREVIVSRGPWPEARVRDGLELLFDDGSTDPYALHLSAESADRLPLPEDVAREWIFTAWVLRDGQPHKALERPCYYRLVPAIPDLSPRRSPGANWPDTHPTTAARR